MQHMVQKHAGQLLLPDSVGQLRCLDRAACTACGTVRSRRCRRCTLCGSDTPLRERHVGDTFQDSRQPGHQSVAPGGAVADQPSQSSRPVSPGEPLDDSPLPNCPIWDIALTERDKHLRTPRRALRTAAGTGPGGGRYKMARSAMREQGRTRTGIASLQHVKLSPMSAPGPTGERQEHLDAIVCFAGAGQRRRCFGSSTFSQSSGLQETCRQNAAFC